MSRTDVSAASDAGASTGVLPESGVISSGETAASANAVDTAAGGDAAPRVRGALGRLIRSEFRLAFGRLRNLALLAGFAALPIVVGLAIYFFTSEARHAAEAPSFLNQVTSNGVFLPLVVLIVSQPFLLPLATGVVTGDAISGEAQTGTLRYLLPIPVSRTRLLAVKWLVVFSFVVAAVAVMAVVGLVLGGALFGWHPLVLLSGDTAGIGNSLARLAGAAAIVAISFLGLSAVGMFISTLTDVPIAAMAATVVVAVVSAILDQIPQLAAIQPGLLTHYWGDSMEFLRFEVDLHAFVPGIVVQLAWAAIFGTLAWARFTSKDIAC